MKLSVEQWIGLVQFGWTTFTQIRAAFQSGKAAIIQSSNAIISGEMAIAALDTAIATALQTGDAAADRLEARIPPQ